jgi:hypothetical protein
MAVNIFRLSLMLQQNNKLECLEMKIRVRQDTVRSSSGVDFGLLTNIGQGC